ncbi:MAG: hypothetical protein WC465_03115 [Patescibacteria group bacterium]
MDLKTLQERIYQNKLNRKFNTEDVGKEIILLTEELGELAKAYKHSNKKIAKEIDNKEEILDAIGDITVYCLGLFAMLDVDSSKILESIVSNNETRTHTGQI